jgi:hypothetical protein
MQRTPVESSHLTAIGYDAAGKIMEVEFRNGAVHKYHGISQTTYDNLMTADSVGSHFAKYIKDAHHNTKVR